MLKSSHTKLVAKPIGHALALLLVALGGAGPTPC